MELYLQNRFSGEDKKDPSTILNRFLDFTREQKLELYTEQEEAILELFDEKNVILNTPTGSGKSLVALALHFLSLTLGRRSIYTCPIKALVNEKFLALCKYFGPTQVGMITGDATVNPEAPILCCTAEILYIHALRSGKLAPFDDVIVDEFHYYTDRERGVAWQVPLLTLSQSRFLLMSATLGDTDFFQTALTKLNARKTAVIKGSQRPVPLNFDYSEISLQTTVSNLIASGKSPIYVVSFTQKECAEEAQNFLSLDFCTKEEKALISKAIEGFKFSSPYGKEIQKLIKHGLGIHHAGLLPKYRVLIEKLAQKGLLKVIFGTDTLGVGVNVPIRSVVFTKLCKFDGKKTSILSVRDFQQISGRAGRKGFDTEGEVIVQAPLHTIENLKLEQKAASDSGKNKKLVKKKPPEKNFVAWNKATFQQLVSGQPETLASQFKVSHSMILNVLSRKEEDGCRALQQIIRSSHESPYSKRKIGKAAFQLFRSLVDRKIIELDPLRVNVSLQEDFSLNNTLSLYLVDTICLLDQSQPDYALTLLTLTESILEDPDAILRKQLDRVKREKMEEMKLEGIEFDKRIEELEKLEYPKPHREFIYSTFNTFADSHPWVGAENIKPKSIAREMYENFSSFSEYIRDYDLHRVEGLLLRYLSDVYKTLVQTIPTDYKSQEVEEIITYIKGMVRQVDSSLLDDWEQMQKQNPTHSDLNGQNFSAPPAPKDFLDTEHNHKQFIVHLRNKIFYVIRALASQDYDALFSHLDSHSDKNEAPWTSEELKTLLDQYYSSEHTRLCTDTVARSPKNTLIDQDSDKRKWIVQQILTDPDQHNDWMMEFEVDLTLSQQAESPHLKLRYLGAI